MNDEIEQDKTEQIALIEDGLEGKWVLETVDETATKQYLLFVKPEKIGGWGKLMLSTSPEIIEYTLLEYEVLVTEDNRAFIDVRVKTVNQVIQYGVHFLNSWQGVLQLNDPNGLYLHYKRLIPRQLPQV